MVRKIICHYHLESESMSCYGHQRCINWDSSHFGGVGPDPKKNNLELDSTFNLDLFFTEKMETSWKRDSALETRIRWLTGILPTVHVFLEFLAHTHQAWCATVLRYTNQFKHRCFFFFF